MPRPSNQIKNVRVTLVLTPENESFLRAYASARGTHLSAAANFLLAAVRENDQGVIEDAATKVSKRRQF